MPDLTPEEQDALATLAKHNRIMVVLVPEDATDVFAARLSAWVNFALDTRLPLPLALPVTRKGDGLVCPYCDQPAAQAPSLHLPTCEWRQAVERWAGAQVQIDEEFGGHA